jgi:hypothetical protein
MIDEFGFLNFDLFFGRLKIGGEIGGVVQSVRAATRVKSKVISLSVVISCLKREGRPA